jgi:hypothetical protein
MAEIGEVKSEKRSWSREGTCLMTAMRIYQCAGIIKKQTEHNLESRRKSGLLFLKESGCSIGHNINPRYGSQAVSLCTMTRPHCTASASAIHERSTASIAVYQ